MYRRSLADALESIQTRSLQEFIPTYLTICELALFSPVLPHYAGLRKDNPDFRQILPVARWIELLRAASHVAPMAGIADHDRYVLEICRYLGWVHPTQMIQITLDWPDNMADPLAMIYLWAQKVRARSGAGFIGLNRFLFDLSPRGEVWRKMFDFVIVDYTDRTYYHPDKDFLQLMTTHELERLGMRCIMTRRYLNVPAPYRGDEAERRWMTDYLRAFFKRVFHRDFPMLQVV